MSHIRARARPHARDTVQKDSGYCLPDWALIHSSHAVSMDLMARIKANCKILLAGFIAKHPAHLHSRDTAPHRLASIRLWVSLLRFANRFPLTAIEYIASFRPMFG